MTSPWLTIVGIGEDGLEGLAPAARELVENAELLAGGERHLEMVPASSAERLQWRSPLAHELAALEEHRGRRVCILASGDPMWFGVGATLARRFSTLEMTIVPHPGAFSLAAARLGWPLQDVLCLSAHGRPLDAVTLHFHPGARLFVLADAEDTPARLAELLIRDGYGTSRMTVLERLGGGGERRREASATEWHGVGCEPLNTVAVEVVGDRGAGVRSRAAGLPESAYENDGQITSRELRAAAIAALSPWPRALLWDIGAGCGSVAIEWARAGGAAVAFERSSARRDMIARNALALGVPQIEIVPGEAPSVLPLGGTSPEAIFVGGGTSRPGMLEAAWDALGSGGRLVAHGVTAEAEMALLAWHARVGGDLVRVAISRLEPTGRFRLWRPAAPVTQLRAVKP